MMHNGVSVMRWSGWAWVCLVALCGPTAHAMCLVPSRDILDACRVGQLSILTQTNLLVRNQDLCNRELSQDILGQKPNLKIENYYSFDFTKNTTFTLVMIDVTSNKLLWMLSNITSMNGDITTTQNSIYNPHVVTVRDYSAPSLPRGSPTATHLIQIFIFQEDNRGHVFPRPQTDPFYIRDWVMQSQSATSKSLMCGPVAGVQLRINQSALSKDFKALGAFVNTVAPSRGEKCFRVEYFVIVFCIVFVVDT